MQEPPIPANEKSRLQSLRSLGVLDTPAEERFDRITRLAKRSLGASVALITLIDEDRQWYKSCQGVNGTQTPRTISFCAHAVAADKLLIVPDATQDPRFKGNPAVVGEPHIRLYAGRPVHAPDGHAVGVLCIIDSTARSLSKEDVAILDDLASMVERELEAQALTEAERELRGKLDDAERRAAVDPLTKAWTRDIMSRLIMSEVTRAARDGGAVTVLMTDIDHFKRVNDSHGHPVGDEVLRSVASRLRGALRSYDSVGRYGGEEFVALLPRCDDAEAKIVAQRICEKMRLNPIEVGSTNIPITVSVGTCTYERTGFGRPAVPSVEQLVARADAALYAAKRDGRDRCEVYRWSPPED